MTLDSETLTPDPHNPDQVIHSDYKTETTEKLLEDYQDSPQPSQFSHDMGNGQRRT